MVEISQNPSLILTLFVFLHTDLLKNDLIMKTRLLFTWLFCICCMSAIAQTSDLEYLPFSQKNKVWERQIGGIKENLYCYQIDGDTILNGETWQKVYSYIAWQQFNYNYFAAVRDVGNKVYAIAKGSNKPRLLYDFDIEVGRTLRCGIEGTSFGCLLENDEPLDTLLGFRFRNYLIVEKIDTIKSSYTGMEYRRFTLKLNDAYNYPIWGIDEIVWIEGIGSGAGPFSPWQPLPQKGGFSQRCYVGDTYIFGQDLYYEEEYPSVVSSPKSAIKKNSAAYDLDGRQLPKAPQKGVYIQNGKKVKM